MREQDGGEEEGAGEEGSEKQARQVCAAGGGGCCCSGQAHLEARASCTSGQCSGAMWQARELGGKGGWEKASRQALQRQATVRCNSCAKRQVTTAKESWKEPLWNEQQLAPHRLVPDAAAWGLLRRPKSHPHCKARNLLNRVHACSLISCLETWKQWVWKQAQWKQDGSTHRHIPTTDACCRVLGAPPPPP